MLDYDVRRHPWDTPSLTGSGAALCKETLELLERAPIAGVTVEIDEGNGAT